MSTNKRTSVEKSVAVSDWFHLMERIQEEDAEATEELYGLFSNGIRFFLRRQVGEQDLESRVDDCVASALATIRNGHLTDLDRLPRLVRTVLMRQIAVIQEKDGGSNAALRDAEGVRNAVEGLEGMSLPERECLTRFYVHNEAEPQVCKEMNLTARQFRAIKSKAKASCQTPVSAPQRRG